jgi:cytosine/adenosine deaminase-related metal-dependent hydrolase
MPSEPAKTLIRGGRVLDLDGDLDRPATADVLVEGARIAAVGADLPPARTAGATVIDATGRLVVPGFVNAHYHSYDVLAKGMMEDLPLEQWSTLIGGLAVGRGLEELRARTLVGAVECLRNGSTTVQDMSTLVPLRDDCVDAILDAYQEAGIRVIYSISIRDLSQLETIPWIAELLPPELHKLVGTGKDAAGPQLDFVARQIDRIGDRGGMVRWALSPSAPQRCTPELLQGVAALARAKRLPVYTHCYETRAQRLFSRDRLAAYGGSAVRMLEETGLTGPHVTIAHGVWPDPDEIARIGATRTNVVINMLSNLKLKSGVAPVLDYVRHGVNLALGCDNCSCSDVQNLFEVMKLFCLMAGVSTPGASPIDAAAALRAATVGGARTAGLEADVGAVKPEHKADLLILDLADPAYVPFNSAVRQLVYADSGRSVETAMVDGKVVIADGRMASIDEASLHALVARVMPTVQRDVARFREDFALVRPYLEEVQRRTWADPHPTNRFVGAPRF